MTATPDPLPIAVVVPAHDHASFLAEAIESALMQHPPPAEMVVVDDGSTDESAAIAEAALGRGRGTRTTLLRQANAGAAAAMNRGAAATNSPWLAFLNDDDVFLPGRLASMHRMLEARGAKVAISGVEFAAEPDGEEIHLFREGYPPGLAEISRLPTFGFGLMAFNLQVTSSNLVIARDLFESIGGFDESLPSSHDLEILWRALRVAEPLLVPQVLLRYRVHGGNNYRRLREQARAEFPIRVAGLAEWAAGDGGEILNPLAPCPARWPRYFPAFARVVKPWPSEVPLSELLPNSVGRPAATTSSGVDEAVEAAAIRSLFVPVPQVLGTVPALERLHASWLGQEPRSS